MRAIRVHENGGVEKLVLDDVPAPEPQAGQVRVRVAATGVNFIEIYQRKGVYRLPLPLTPGSEFAGTVDALGAGVTGFKAGDRVATTSGTGGYAEYALAAAEKLVSVPDGIALETAAAVMLQGITAHYLTASTYPLKAGETALIHAAAGGVGQLLVQIAKMRGARVIATAGNAEKVQIARDLGADLAINYTEQDFEALTKEFTGGKGVDVVYDGVGKETFSKGLNLLRPRGYMVLYGQSSGGVDPLDPQILNQKGSLYLTRPSIGFYLLNRDELLWRTGDLFAWLASGALKLRIDQVFPLDQAGAAHAYLEGRKTKGKVILKP